MTQHDPRQPDRHTVHYSTNTDQWNSPAHIVEKAITILGGIDLDPCSTPPPARTFPPYCTTTSTTTDSPTSGSARCS